MRTFQTFKPVLESFTKLHRVNFEILVDLFEISQFVLGKVAYKFDYI